MSDFTLKNGKNEVRYETFEWDNVWIDHANDKTTKRVLYIGDSISVGTRKELSKLFGDRVLFDGFATSKSVDNPFFKDALKLFIKQLNRVDAILFNNGLHGGHLDDAEYYQNYRDIVSFLRENHKDIPIYILYTTYAKTPFGMNRVPGRNVQAERIAKEFGLNVIDLYDITYQNKELISNDNIHLTDEGYLALADTIRTALEKETEIR